MNLFSLFNIVLVTSYSSTFHQYLGKTLEQNLPTPVLDNFENCSLSRASLWADRNKKSAKYNWTSKLHYIDLFDCNARLDDLKCSGNCISDSLGFLQNNNYDNLTNYQNWALFLHLSQDIFQPLHSCGYQRGGNNRKFKLTSSKWKKSKKVSLHQLFDNYLPATYISRLDRSFVQIPRTYIHQSSSVLDIINKNLAFCCKNIDFDVEELNLEEYYDKIDGDQYYSRLIQQYISFTKSAFYKKQYGSNTINFSSIYNTKVKTVTLFMYFVVYILAFVSLFFVKYDSPSQSNIDDYSCYPGDDIFIEEEINFDSDTDTDTSIIII